MHSPAPWATDAAVTLSNIKPQASLLATEKPPVDGSIPPLTTALPDRLTYHCHIIESGNGSTPGFATGHLKPHLVIANVLSLQGSLSGLLGLWRAPRGGGPAPVMQKGSAASGASAAALCLPDPGQRISGLQCDVCRVLWSGEST